MGYLDENPEFHHQLLLVRGVSDEQHTAEVGLIARHMRERFGVRVVILGRAATEFDAVANRVRKADLAEPLVDPEPRSGRWWPRAALAAAEAPLTADSRARVARWAAGDVAVAASHRRYPPAVVQAHPWMREMPAFCLSRILARRAAAAGPRE